MRGGFGGEGDLSLDINKPNHFLLNYNLVMLACHYEAINILQYLYDYVILRSPDPEKMKEDMLYSTKKTAGGV